MTLSIANILAERSIEGSLAEERPISIPHGDGQLTGSVALVPRPNGVLILVSDRGCSRHSPQTRRLTAEMRRQGFATVILDLLMPAEVGDPPRAAWMRLQVEELARRIGCARAWIAGRPELAGLPVVVFGQGAGAAPALLSAGARPANIAAVIVHGATPDTIGFALESVRAPVLLLVDFASHELVANLRAHARLNCRKAIRVMRGRSGPEDCAAAVAGWLGAQFQRFESPAETVKAAGTVPAV